MGVAQQRYFYRLQELNPKERDLIRQFAIRNSYGALKESNEQWLQQFSFVFDLKKILEEKGVLDEEAKRIFKEAEIQLEESLHSIIEGQSKKYLDMLLDQDTSFYENEEDAMQFCFFFAMQYVRTPRILENMKINITEISGIDIHRVWSVSKIIVATNIAWAMFARRNEYAMSILFADGNRFIAGDQPIINTRAVAFDETPTAVEWFYPLSPRMAVLISESAQKGTLQISESEVQKYNELMFNSSYEQVYAIEEADLKAFQIST